MPRSRPECLSDASASEEEEGLDSHHTSCCFQLMSLSDCLHWLKWNLHQNAHTYFHVPSDSVVCGVVGCELGIRTCFVPL